MDSIYYKIKMIIEDREVSLSRVFFIVGIIVFVSSMIYISVITSKLISLRKNRIIRDNVAKEKYEKPGIGTSQPYQIVSPAVTRTP